MIARAAGQIARHPVGCRVRPPRIPMAETLRRRIEEPPAPRPYQAAPRPD